jgi:hypothetical protein
MPSGGQNNAPTVSGSWVITSKAKSWDAYLSQSGASVSGPAMDNSAGVPYPGASLASVAGTLSGTTLTFTITESGQTTLQFTATLGTVSNAQYTTFSNPSTPINGRWVPPLAGKWQGQLIGADGGGPSAVSFTLTIVEGPPDPLGFPALSGTLAFDSSVGCAGNLQAALNADQRGDVLGSVTKFYPEGLILWPAIVFDGSSDVIFLFGSGGPFSPTFPIINGSTISSIFLSQYSCSNTGGGPFSMTRVQ